MALPKAGTGYQVNDGNPSNVILTKRTVTNLVGAAPVASAAALATGFIVLSHTASTTLNLPTAAQLDDYFVDCQPGYSFDVELFNNGGMGVAFTYTLAGGSGITLIGKDHIDSLTSGKLRFIKVSRGVWTLYGL